MKKYIYLLSFVIFVGLSLPSCGPSEKEIREKAEKEERAKIEKERQDSIQAAEAKAEALRLEEENKRAEEERRKEEEREREIEKNSFTTSKGRFSSEGAIQEIYNRGVKLGAMDKRHTQEMNSSYYHFSGNGTEEHGKTLFINWFGIPSDEKAEQILAEAVKKYTAGYEDGWNY